MSVAQQERTKRILVVDDEEVARLPIKNLFFRHNYEVLEAANGKQGLALARSYLPAAIITDLRMPVMDGFEMIRHLRADPSTSPLYILVFSVIVQENVYHRSAIEEGANIVMDREYLKGVKFVPGDNPLEVLLDYVEKWPTILQHQYSFGKANSRFQLDRFGEMAIIAGVPESEISGLVLSLYKALLKHPDRLWTTTQLARQVYADEAYEGDNEKRLIRLVRRLREKIEEKVEKPQYLITCSGGRYRFNNPETDAF